MESSRWLNRPSGSSSRRSELTTDPSRVRTSRQREPREPSAIARAAARPVDLGAHTGRAAGVAIGLDLGLERQTFEASDVAIELDSDGLPALPGGRTWPLEMED